MGWAPGQAGGAAHVGQWGSSSAHVVAATIYKMEKYEFDSNAVNITIGIRNKGLCAVQTRIRSRSCTQQRVSKGKLDKEEKIEHANNRGAKAGIEMVGSRPFLLL